MICHPVYEPKSSCSSEKYYVVKDGASGTSSGLYPVVWGWILFWRVVTIASVIVIFAIILGLLTLGEGGSTIDDYAQDFPGSALRNNF